MSDNDLIRRGDVREALRDVEAWTMANANAVHRLPAVSIQPMIDAAVAKALEQAASLSGWWIGITPSGEPDGTYCSVPPHDDPHSEKYVSASRIRALRPAAQPAPDAAAIREALLSLPAVYAHQINTGVREVYDPLQRFYTMEDVLRALIVREADPVNRPMMTDLMVDPESIPDMEMEYDHRAGGDDE